MKTIYSIGRDEASDIVLWDDNNVISRTHAFIRIGKGGQYTITDQSMNGTYVNGMKIASGVEVPVKRSDSISFAHQAELDWSQIPNPARKKRFVLLIVLVAVVALCFGVCFAYQAIKGKVASTVSNAVENVISEGDNGGGDYTGGGSIFGYDEEDEASDLDDEVEERPIVKKEPPKPAETKKKLEPAQKAKQEPQKEKPAVTTTPVEPPVPGEAAKQEKQEETETTDALF